jgi:delta8-fatty-acid desaturase
MLKYRVGILTEPWTNKTPPIRGGVFVNPDDTNAWDSDTELSDTSTLYASSVSSGSTIHDNVATARPATINQLAGSVASSENVDQNQKPAVVLPKRDAVTEALIHKTIQGEIDDNIRDYPSLDPQTQRDIENRYKTLHERVKAGGFYECHYLEYAKELSRYLTIFGLFMTALTCGWYWTSAALLGLFWVCEVTKHIVQD